MPRTWVTIRVELLGGRGEELWPPPGRVLAVGPKHTFADLARSVDEAFARWDRAHLCQFRLADGRTVTDRELAEELAASPFGPLPAQALLLERTKVLGTVGPGDEFCYVFDLGDDWIHRCTVEQSKIDPRDELGSLPDRPVALCGWGVLPDQHGRRWADDPGSGPVPARPRDVDPMLTGWWPETPAAPVELTELRGATYRWDVATIRRALEGRTVDDCLQHAGIAVQVLLAEDRRSAEELAASVAGRLSARGGPGDAVLVEDLVAGLQGTPTAGRSLAVDLHEVSEALEGGLSEEGGYLDLETGDVVPAFVTDEAMVGDAYVDVDADPGRWLFLGHEDGHDAWQDMADFAELVADQATRRRLLTAIEGKGAFRRFRDEVDEAGLVDRWRAYSDDRRIGRARDHLAELGIRALPPLPH